MSEKKKRLKSNVDNRDAQLLSDDELKMLAASRGEIDRSTLPHYDNSDIAIAKRYAKKNKTTVIFVAVTITLVLAVIAVLSIFLYQKLADAPSKDDYVLTLGDEEYVIKYKNAMKNDVLYLDIIQIARYADLVVSGSTKSLKITCDDGTYVRFENGKNIATINGDSVKLGGTAYINTLDDESNEKIECLIPFTFIEKLFSYQVENGTSSLYVSLKKSNKILIRRKIYKESELPLPISFSADCFDLVIN